MLFFIFGLNHKSLFFLKKFNSDHLFLYFFVNKRISNWAIRFGAQMWEIGKQVTRIREIREVSMKSSTSSYARSPFGPFTA